MRGQMRRTAVLPAAAALALGVSMMCSAAETTGAGVDGGWGKPDARSLYYGDDEKITDQWKKSGESWYWLDSGGEIAVDQIIEYKDNFYYVDNKGVMVANQWVAIDNADAGQEGEPDHYWYYFQEDGRAMKNGSGSKVSIKNVNGKKYAFDDQGRMIFGWVCADSTERIDNSGGEGFMEGDYYFGGEDDGAMTVGWLELDITYEEAADDYEAAPAFNENEDQSRWFYFKSNGKKVRAVDGDALKERTINGKRYSFDRYGAMTAEWSLDVDHIRDHASASYPTRASNSTPDANDVGARYAREWRYFNSVEDGSKIKKGWFKVVAAEYLNYDKYDEEEDAWYYADGSGNLYAGEFKTIGGKKYAFRNDGRMVDGLTFIRDNKGSIDVWDADEDPWRYDTEEDFDENCSELELRGYRCYYFGDGEDGSMRTGPLDVETDDGRFDFFFEKSGRWRGAGRTDIKDGKCYQSGKRMRAGTDEKYQAVTEIRQIKLDDDGNIAAPYEEVASYQKAEGVSELIGWMDADYDSSIQVIPTAHRGYERYTGVQINSTVIKKLKDLGVTKSPEDLSEVYFIARDYGKLSAGRIAPLFLVNTSGKIINSNSTHKDGEGYCYVVEKNGNTGRIVAIYSEN